MSTTLARPADLAPIGSHRFRADPSFQDAVRQGSWTDQAAIDGHMASDHIAAALAAAPEMLAADPKITNFSPVN